MKTLLTTLAMATALQAVASNPTVTAKWRYQTAENGAVTRDSQTVAVPAPGFGSRAASDEVIYKTLFLVEVVNTLQGSLTDFEKACQAKEPVHPMEKSMVPQGGIMPRPVPRPINPAPCETERAAVADVLLAHVNGLNERLLRNPALSDEKVLEVMDLGRKLAKNMKEAKSNNVLLETTGGIRMKAMAAGGPGLNVTGGGAQDFGFFRKVVEDGYVPGAKTLTVEGFLSEFNLAMGGSCDQLICVNPGVVVDMEKGKLYVQVGMNSNVTKETFKRKPLNLSVVLDISGSMSATDNTEKSRLEWAKDALTHTVNQLNAEDVISIVLFDTESEILVKSQPATDAASIIEKVKALKTRGSTNMEAGLRNGYEEVSRELFDLEGYENRVILISDAGLNTGVTSEDGLLKLVTDYANEGIGLTAIGLGLNFNQDFIHGITKSRGGNYIFVHSGKAMFRFFESFDYLVTPVAYNFKASVSVDGLDAKLVKAYGVPADVDAPVQELVDIQTLFFSEAGGAILLEYDIKR